jgi:N-acetylglutamate synthase-like GNAT family acetyltransferase
MIELIAFAEIPRIPNAEYLQQQASELMFIEVGQKELGDSPTDAVAQKIYREEVENFRLFAGVDRTGKVLGSATLSQVFSEPSVMSLAVMPEYRRNRIGGRLLFIVEKAAKHDGASRLIIYPTDSSRPFYEAQGYKVVLEDHDEYLAKPLK